MQDWLSARVIARPDAPALFYAAEGVAWTYAELNAHVERCRARLGAALTGERVGVLLNNAPAYVVVIHALMRCRAVIVPLNTRLTAPELAWQVAHTGCTLLIHDEETAAAADAVLLPPGCERVQVEVLLADGTVDTSQLPPPPVDLDAPLAVVFTSGTTGQPKGAVLSYGNFFYSAMASAYHLGVLPDDRWLCILPLYHVGGLSVILRSCLYGTAVDLYPRFDPHTLHHALTTQPITLISLVPTMLYRLLQQHPPEAAWMPTLRWVLMGGAATTPELLAQARAAGLPIATTYGLTEATSQVATALNPTGATVGKPLLFSEVRIVDEDGQPAPPGTHGEVVVRGLTVMQGYYDNPEATAKTLREDGLHTGDIGYVDAAGDLWLVQRRSDLIVTGGENVYPAEVEAVLRAHPAVDDACVVGLPHPEWGQQVAAALVLKAAATPEDIIAFSRARLAGYKQPRRVRFVEALPQTASGKIKRNEVVELF